MKLNSIKLFNRFALTLVMLIAAGTASAQGKAPLDIALSHLSDNAVALGLTSADLAEKSVAKQYRTQHNGVTHIYFQQMSQGIEVANGALNVNVTADGRILNVGNRFVGNLAGKINSRRPVLDAESAIRAAAEQLGLEVSGTLIETVAPGGPARAARFSPAGLSLDDIPVKLAFYMLESGEVRLTWETNIQQVDQQHWWNLWVDAETGKLLAKVDWIANDGYEVFAQPKESPLDGSRTIETDPAEATASPYGWHDTNGVDGAEYTVTRGNNVCAQTDRDANNSACGTETQPDGSSSLNFTGSVVPLDLTTQSPVDYRDAAVVNLFYFNNIMHDVLYRYGFDEASGNFQENNYGRGGAGSDSVNADAQDGSGTDNANFSTPPDGSNPRMQMYEWTPTASAILTVNSPGSIAGDYSGAAASFGGALTAGGTTGDLELVDDGTALGSEGCNSLTGFTSGRIALIDRGSCEFGTKLLNAQSAGASAAVVINNSSTGVIAMGPGNDGNRVNIPGMMISLTDGNTIKAGLGGGANGTVKGAGSSTPNRDSDLDNGIIAHEYCHGLSNRLTGGAQTSNCLSGNQQAGEGWSDLCALFVTAKVGDQGANARGIGNYSIFEPTNGPGIRPFPYSTDMTVNPLTYGDLTGNTLSIPHGVGTVWATAVWEMYWNLVNDQGFDPDLITGTSGNNTAIQLVIDGLKLQGCNPTFLDARDAILAADVANNGGANECLIWSAFAKRGMGVNATDGGTSNSLNVVENFDLPAQCADGCGNGICELGEDCNTCPGDCVGGSSSGAVCGNGICEAGNGEDCLSCAADCNGVTSGKPSNRFCCGDGDGQNPLTCSDSACSASGNTCTDIPASGGAFCCGDFICDGGESCSNCALDCTAGAVEICGTGIDEDCNLAVDCADASCSTDEFCQAPPEVDCSIILSKNSCNAATSCRWDNRAKTCINR